MNELIRVTENDGKSVVEARELHDFLEVKSKFATWITNRIEEYGFAENQDYISISKNLENGGRSKEYTLTLDMAKELAMVERSEKGRMARQYFIEVEKRYRAAMAHPALLQMKEMYDNFISRVRTVTINGQVCYNVNDVRGFFNYHRDSKSFVLFTCVYAPIGYDPECYMHHDAFIDNAIRSTKTEVKIIAQMLKGGEL